MRPVIEGGGEPPANQRLPHPYSTSFTDPDTSNSGRGVSNLEGLPADLGIETGEGYLAVMGQGKSEP